MLATLNTLISSILLNKRYSYCRLCLKDIQEKPYVELEDSVSVSYSFGDQRLSHILSDFVGPQICEEIPGLEAICTECWNKILQIFQFVDKCKNSAKLLNTAFSHLFEALSTDIELPDPKNNQSLYIVMNNDHTELIIVNQKQHRSKKKQYKCESCEKAFTTVHDYFTHNAEEHNIIMCVKCFKSFQNSIELSSHLKYNHLYSCPICDYNGEDENGLLKHNDAIHEEYVCKICDKSFNGQIKYKRHEAKHYNKRPCPHCGKMYLTLDSFNKHVDLCMQGLYIPHPIRSEIEKKYQCNQCKKAYSTSGGLRVHERFAHENACPHVCKICNKKFTAPSFLKAHMVTHTKERNFDCMMCGHKFVSKEALLYHTRRHTGEKPYSCIFCNERFVNASSRAEHMKFKHIGPKLMCEICSHKFFSKSFLRQHINRHYDPASRLYIGKSAGSANEHSKT